MTDLHEIDYAELTERVRMIDKSIDDGKWYIGDIALAAITVYSKTMKDFASDTQMKYDTARGYKRMSEFYDPETRKSIYDSPLGEVVNWSILLVAKTECDKPDDAIAFLERCAAKGISWSAQEVLREKQIELGKPPKPKRVGKCEIVLLDRSHSSLFDGWYSIQVTDDEIASQLKDGKEYIIEIWEKSE